MVLVRLRPHRDGRGSFARTFCSVTFEGAGIRFCVVQSNVSRNTARQTLRGMHFQEPPYGEGRLVYCSHGRIWDLALDMRPTSPTFRRWEAFELGGKNDAVLHLPAGIAHGFLTLEPNCEVHYFMDAEFASAAARGIRFDDPAIRIVWPAPPAVISERDRSYPLLDCDP